MDCLYLLKLWFAWFLVCWVIFNYILDILDIILWDSGFYLIFFNRRENPCWGIAWELNGHIYLASCWAEAVPEWRAGSHCFLASWWGGNSAPHLVLTPSQRKWGINSHCLLPPRGEVRPCSTETRKWQSRGLTHLQSRRRVGVPNSLASYLPHRSSYHLVSSKWAWRLMTSVESEILTRCDSQIV